MGLLTQDEIDNNLSFILDFAAKVKYRDEHGNDFYDFEGEIEYIYNSKRINEIGKFVVRNIEGYSSPGILILSESLEINKDKVHIEFNTAFQNFELQNNTLIIATDSSKIGAYQVLITPNKY